MRSAAFDEEVGCSSAPTKCAGGKGAENRAAGADPCGGNSSSESTNSPSTSENFGQKAENEALIIPQLDLTGAQIEDDIIKNTQTQSKRVWNRERV